MDERTAAGTLVTKGIGKTENEKARRNGASRVPSDHHETKMKSRHPVKKLSQQGSEATAITRDQSKEQRGEALDVKAAETEDEGKQEKGNFEEESTPTSSSIDRIEVEDRALRMNIKLKRKSKRLSKSPPKDARKSLEAGVMLTHANAQINELIDMVTKQSLGDNVGVEAKDHIEDPKVMHLGTPLRSAGIHRKSVGLVVSSSAVANYALIAQAAAAMNNSVVDPQPLLLHSRQPSGVVSPSNPSRSSWRQEVNQQRLNGSLWEEMANGLAAEREHRWRQQLQFRRARIASNQAPKRPSSPEMAQQIPAVAVATQLQAKPPGRRRVSAMNVGPISHLMGDSRFLDGHAVHHHASGVSPADAMREPPERAGGRQQQQHHRVLYVTPPSRASAVKQSPTERRPSALQYVNAQASAAPNQAGAGGGGAAAVTSASRPAAYMHSQAVAGRPLPAAAEISFAATNKKSGKKSGVPQELLEQLANANDSVRLKLQELLTKHPVSPPRNRRRASFLQFQAYPDLSAQCREGQSTSGSADLTDPFNLKPRSSEQLMEQLLQDNVAFSLKHCCYYGSAMKPEVEAMMRDASGSLYRLPTDFVDDYNTAVVPPLPFEAVNQKARSPDEGKLPIAQSDFALKAAQAEKQLGARDNTSSKLPFPLTSPGDESSAAGTEVCDLKASPQSSVESRYTRPPLPSAPRVRDHKRRGHEHAADPHTEVPQGLLPPPLDLEPVNKVPGALRYHTGSNPTTRLLPPPEFPKDKRESRPCTSHQRSRSAATGRLRSQSVPRRPQQENESTSQPAAPRYSRSQHSRSASHEGFSAKAPTGANRMCCSHLYAPAAPDLIQSYCRAAHPMVGFFPYYTAPGGNAHHAVWPCGFCGAPSASPPWQAYWMPPVPPLLSVPVPPVAVPPCWGPQHYQHGMMMNFCNSAMSNVQGGAYGSSPMLAPSYFSAVPPPWGFFSSK